VLKGLKEMSAMKQFERMQGEILEGWTYKIKVEVERAMKKNNCPVAAYNDVMKAIEEVIEREFDTTKL
jgi:aerobic-type carbon monoxide dehydrogenase small subunit (CoxS/CutS family)